MGFVFGFAFPTIYYSTTVSHKLRCQAFCGIMHTVKQLTMPKEAAVKGNKYVSTARTAVAVLAIAVIIFTSVACSANNSDLADIDMDYLYESQSHTDIVIPDLRGYLREELTLQFRAMNLTPTFVRLVSDEPVGTVLFIERMGQNALPAATLEVHISGGLLGGTTTETESEQPPSPHINMMFGGINWRVLDRQEHKVLLLSEYILFYRPYNDMFIDVTWESSTLRHHLNGDFLNRFSSEERARIAETRVINNDILVNLGGASWYAPGGNDTDDMIFLLSTEEAKKFFENDSKRRAINTGFSNTDTDADSW